MKKNILMLVVVVLAGVSAHSTVEAEVLYNVTIFEPQLPGGYTTFAESINDSGVIVGSTRLTIDGGNYQHATIFDSSGNGNDVDLLPGMVHSEAHAVNNNGTIVGEAQTQPRAVIFDPSGSGNYTDIGEGYAFAVNNNEQIVGRKRVNGVSAGAFTWDAVNGESELGWGNTSTASGVNDFGGVVGVGQIDSNPYGAAFFDPRSGGDHIYLGGTQAHDINNDWQIVGHADFSGENHAALFDPTGGGVNIDLGGDNSEAYAINDIGQIVGWSATPGYDHSAMLFDPTGNGNNIDLNTVLDPLYSGPHLRLALDINSDGWIVGEAGTGNSSRGFLLTPIPEPATLTLLSLGTLALRRRRSRQQQS